MGALMGAAPSQNYHEKLERIATALEQLVVQQAARRQPWEPGPYHPSTYPGSGTRFPAPHSVTLEPAGLDITYGQDVTALKADWVVDSEGHITRGIN